MLGIKFVKINQSQLDHLASYMNDNIREDLHGRIDTDTPNKFLCAYIKRDKELVGVIKQEFKHLIQN